jgi:pimeloyl-ACP methyl ester carboxylesterase
MPTARVNGIGLFYEEFGAGVPLVFVHEFAGDYQSWHLQVRYFARRYRTIAYNAAAIRPPTCRRARRLFPGPGG